MGQIYFVDPGQFCTGANNIAGLSGDNLIVRDRPGDYTAAADTYYAFNGDVEIWGYLSTSAPDPGGTHTISYSLYAGGIEIDLDVGDGTGVARQYGLSGMTIHGEDILYKFANATGTQGFDLITGSAEDNRLRGLGGNDSMWGEAGDDTIDGDAGDDTIDAGAGDDSVEGDGGDDEILGGSGNDILRGGDDDDLIQGGGDDDQIFGDAGNDTLNGDGGNDEIRGGSGVDEIDGGAGNDEIWLQGLGGVALGGSGADTLHGSAVDDELFGGSGNDDLSGGGGDDYLVGGFGLDTIDGGSGTDTAYFQSHAGNAVHVTLDASGDGTAEFGPHDDVLFGIENVITASGADTVILSGVADNRVETGMRADLVVAGGGDDTVCAGSGHDTVHGESGEDVLFGEAGNDEIWGHSQDDLIQGGDGHDSLFGGHGDDFVIGGAGNDEIHGGQGVDMLSGHEGEDLLFGNSGDDVLAAGSGNDILFGGSGLDLMLGGSGADGFVWQAGQGVELDKVLDFEIGTDWIGFEGDFFDTMPGAGGSYSESVLAMAKLDGSGTVLVGLIDGIFQGFAELVGVDAVDAQAAVADGSLFSSGTAGGFGSGNGPGAVTGGSRSDHNYDDDRDLDLYVINSPGGDNALSGDEFAFADSAPDATIGISLQFQFPGQVVNRDTRVTPDGATGLATTDEVSDLGLIAAGQFEEMWF